MSTPAATASSQNVTIPSIPELYDPNFLNVLLPVANTNREKKVVEGSTQPSNPMIEALKKVSHRTRTENNSPAYDSTSDAVLDAFHSLRPYATGKEIWRHLDKAWEQNPEMTLRVIWNLRSIHDGKSAREEFYHAWGWLYKNHPRTAIMNLPLLVKPVCTIKKNKNLAPHGYWKDLLNLLCLAALDQLKPTDSQFHYLHCGKMPPASEDDTFFSKIRRRFANPTSRRKASKVPQKSVEQLKAEAKEERAKVNVRLHENLLRKLAEPQFRALYIMVARLFAERLSEDVHILLKAESLPEGDERRDLMRSISLAGKWAPSPGLSHDRHTNIASAISQLLHHSYYPGPSKVTVDPSQPLLPAETHILRSYYQRWVLTELRRAILVPEPLMSANRWKEIRYNRVASVCMKNNTENFYKHDPEGFEKYMLDVESGKRTISGATLLPHELVVDAMICYQDMEHQINPKRPSTADVRKRLAEMKIRVVEGQWKTMLDRVKEAGKLDNALAVCDVSGSIGILSGVTRKCASQPIAPAIGLSLVLAQVAQPPFQNKFITFSAKPRFVDLDPKQSLLEQINTMEKAAWSMNTDFNAVFLDLLLPLAKKHAIKQEDMIKRLFVFTDMQFDEARSTGQYDANRQFIPSTDSWETNHDVIERAFKEAGYELPEIVYWNLSERSTTTTPVTSDKKGVAIMSGWSPGMLKVFMGEEEVEQEWEDVRKDEKPKAQEEFNPINIMNKALSKASFNELVIMD